MNHNVTRISDKVPRINVENTHDPKNHKFRTSYTASFQIDMEEFRFFILLKILINSETIYS